MIFSARWKRRAITQKERDPLRPKSSLTAIYLPKAHVVHKSQALQSRGRAGNTDH